MDNPERPEEEQSLEYIKAKLVAAVEFTKTLDRYGDLRSAEILLSLEGRGPETYVPLNIDVDDDWVELTWLDEEGMGSNPSERIDLSHIQRIE